MKALVAAPIAEVRFTAHHLGGHHCDGELVFTKADFRFKCYNITKETKDNNFTVERNLATLDDNGVYVAKGDKHYHFNVVGYKKRDDVHKLFSEWLESTPVPGATRPGNEVERPSGVQF